MSSVAVKVADSSEKQRIRNLMQAYLHDLSEFSGEEPKEDGLFDVGDYFDVFWVEPTRHPYLITSDDLVVGFALIREFEKGHFSMSEFFVLRGQRRTGIGQQAAKLLFDQFAGIWHVAQEEFNLPAQKFWNQVIDSYSEGNYQEQWSNEMPRGPRQIFTSYGT